MLPGIEEFEELLEGARDNYARAVELGRGTGDPNQSFYEEHLANAEAALGQR